MPASQRDHRTIRLTSKGDREVTRLKADPAYRRAKARQIQADRRRRSR
jgi:hypothetical protein